MTRIILTGGSGLLGPYLADALQSLGTVISVSRSACDLTDEQAVRVTLCDLKPDCIVNAAALTDVDVCEHQPVRADRVNHLIVRNLTQAMAPHARLVQLSTDQVYPNRPGLHREENADPINVYGRTKLAGEMAALQHPNSLVLRVNLFGPSRTPTRASLSDFVVSALRNHQPITLFEDVFFSPLHMATLSTLVAELAAMRQVGILNLGSNAGMSKKDFALAVARHLGLDASCARAGLSTGRADRAPRPLDLRMCVSKAEACLGRRLPVLLDEIALLTC